MSDESQTPADAPSEALSPKHAPFVAEYLKDRNAAAAAQRAGYSPRSAASLMAQEHIREAIKKRPCAVLVSALNH
jgi:phage terminase small subunit